VFSAKLVSMDTDILLRKAKGDDFAEKFGQLMQLLSDLNLSDAQTRAIGQMQIQVRTSLMEKLQEILPAKLEEKGNIKVSRAPVFPVRFVAFARKGLALTFYNFILKKIYQQT
jgi:hypothetical protein